MKSTLFELSRYFIRTMIAIFIGFSASSCATQTNIPAITAEAKTTLMNLDEDDRPHHPSGERSLQADDITEGVVSDYITLIDYLIERNELRAKTLAPTVPLFMDSSVKYPRVVFFYRGQYEIDRVPNGREYVKEVCDTECANILFYGHAESVLNVKIDPHSLEIVPSSIREFRKINDCSQSFEKPVSFQDLPALGLCTQAQTPENGLELIEKEGLHVYGDRHHLISPLAPKEFWVDTSRRLPNPGILAIAYGRGITVMKNLEHVTARSDNDTRHRAIGIRANGHPIEYQMLFDYTCLLIEPELPEAIVKKLITQRAGKKYLNPSWREGDKLYFEAEQPLCQGKDYKGGLFSSIANGYLNFPYLFSPQEIEERLNATLNAAKSKGDTAAEWQEIGKALTRLDWHYFEFDSEIAPRVAPVLIELAKRNRRAFKDSPPIALLRNMPHKSMEPHIDDLIWIIEDTLSGLGCEDFKCSEDTRSSQLFHLAEILNGAGPKAADYLDLIEQANNESIESYGGRRIGLIGGVKKAKICIQNRYDCFR